VRGERGALAALVRNLIDNAVRYSPEGRASRSASAATAQGACCASTTRARHSARRSEPRLRPLLPALASDEDGTGLGLAIVRSVADRHGAATGAREAPAGGLRVTLRFDAAPRTGRRVRRRCAPPSHVAARGDLTDRMTALAAAVLTFLNRSLIEA
jgi:K+-sensing histidine kinase KdpD